MDVGFLRGRPIINQDKENGPILNSNISADEIRRQLDRLLASPDFQVTPQQSALLNYVVNQTLSGNASLIKGYTVATEAFGRKSDFNQSIDPIVSIQAAGLRKALEFYYLRVGKHDPVRIDIPKGTFVPVFEKQYQALSDDAGICDKAPDIKLEISWPAVLVEPLRNLSGDPDLEFWGIGLATELANELSRYPDIRALTLGAGNPRTEADQHTAQFAIKGTVRCDSLSVKTNLQLVNTQTGYQIWSDAHYASVEADQLIALQEDIARKVAIKIASEQGCITKTLDKASKRGVVKCSAVYEAILRYYEYNLKNSPKTFSSAFIALEKAVSINPECGQVWIMLAHLYADIYAIDIPGFENPLEKAFACGQNSVRLSPGDQRSRVYMAYIHLLRNDLEVGLVETEQAYQQGPQTLFLLDYIGYMLTLLGDWERGPALIEKVIRLNPFHSNTVYYGLWLNNIRRKDYFEALQDTLNLNRPDVFWYHLARASTHGLIGSLEDGRKAAADLLRLKPDFSERGRTLIRHYIKFEELVERVIEGLTAVGITVN